MDDKSKQDDRDRSKVAGGKDYEVAHVAAKFGLTTDQVRDLIEKHGNDRETLERKARALVQGVDDEAPPPRGSGRR